MNNEEKLRQYEIAEKLMSEQNFPMAVICGAAVMFICVAALGSIGGVGVGFMAAAIGLLIGVAMQYVGKGIETRFAVVASAFAFVACLLSNLFAIATFVARANGVGVGDVLSSTAPSELASWVIEDLQHVDLIFWMLAVGAAAYFSKRRLSRKERLAIGMSELRR